MPESNARCQSASSLERPDGAQRFPGLGEQVEQGLVLRAELLVEVPPEVGGERRAAAAGADATTRSARRTTDISVKEQLAGSSALLTQTRAGLARRVAPPR